MDTRRDPGQYYPGGKVIPTRPVATGGDVKHSDFEDLDVKTNTLPDLRAAVKGLAARLGATVVTALAVCVAIGATVTTAPLNDLEFDTNPQVVTNVTFEGLAESSNVYTKAETEAKIVELAPAPGNYSVVSNRAMNAVQTETDPVFDAWADSPQVDHLDIVGTEFSTGMIPLSGNYSDYSWRWYRDYVAITRNFYESRQMVSNQTVRVYLPDHAEIHDNDTFMLYSQVPSWAKAASKPSYTAAEVGAVPTTGGTMTGGLTVPNLTVGSRKAGSTVGVNSVAEGYNSAASGNYSRAAGHNSTASGDYSRAEGFENTASGSISHAEGFATTAGGVASHAEGHSTITRNRAEHAQGIFNNSHTGAAQSEITLSSIGFGTANNDRKNAVETMQDGKTFIYGLGGYDGTNPTGAGVQDLATAFSTFSSALDGKLDLAGGTMTGVLHIPYGLLSVEGGAGARWNVTWLSAMDEWEITIKPEDSATPYHIRIPKTGGTLALLSDIPTTMAWGAITGKPTTISGYGITDALKSDFASLTNNTAFTSAVAAVSPPADTSELEARGFVRIVADDEIYFVTITTTQTEE